MKPHASNEPVYGLAPVFERDQSRRISIEDLEQLFDCLQTDEEIENMQMNELVFDDPYAKILKFGQRQIRILAAELANSLASGFDRSFSARVDQTCLAQFACLYALKYGGLPGLMKLVEETNDILARMGSGYRLHHSPREKPKQKDEVVITGGLPGDLTNGGIHGFDVVGRCN